MPPADSVQVFPLTGLGEVTPATDLAALITGAVAPADPAGPELAAGDVVVVTQKIVSKAEGRIVELDHADPQAKLALVRQESVRILRQRGDLLISETRHGFICANAGIDLSNVADGTAALLPEDSDRSARRIRAGLENTLGIVLGVIVSDTFGRPWRRGGPGVAIGGAGGAGASSWPGRSASPTSWPRPRSWSWARTAAFPSPSCEGCRRSGSARPRYRPRWSGRRTHTS